MKSKNFLPSFTHTQFGEDLHLLLEEKGISFASLSQQDIALFRLPALHIRYSCTTSFARSLLICHICVQGQILEQGDLTGGLPVTPGLELNVYFSRVSAVRDL